MRYRLRAGSFAWMIQRISGVALTIYIFFHLYYLSSLRDPVKFELLRKLLDDPFVKFGEAGLLLLVIAHSFNGIRLILLDMGVPTRMQKTLFFIAALTGGIIFFIGSWPILGGIL
ncbi:MAG: succinate dehydrogenase, cytochrome b556 subunit [Nitrospirae bacterium]|nr:succinate dehydrogenase, cytochrome b556 subunit [Nitrospirota bacterium]